MAIGRRLRVLREQRQMTQGQLAEDAEMTRDQVASIEIGRRDVSSAEVGRMALVLDVSVDAIIRGGAQRLFRPDLAPDVAAVVSEVSSYTKDSIALRDLEWLYASEL